MAATEAVETPVFEQPPSTEEAKPVEKAVKEKKPKQSKTAAHPPYFQMIKEALLYLNEKSGSSPYAIAKYMEEKHKPVLPANFKKILSLQLKNSVTRGKLIKIKASYKLSEEDKKDKGTAKVVNAGIEKKPKATGTRSGTKTRSVNKTEAPKKSTKKVAAKKAKKSTPAKPKQPKSIKSPAAKRAKRASAA